MTYLWNADLVTFLEELGVLLDEFLGGHVLDGHALLFVDAVHVQLICTSNQSVFHQRIVLTSIFVLGLASCLIDDNQY